MKRLLGILTALAMVYVWWRLQPQEQIAFGDEPPLLQLKRLQLSQFTQDAQPALHLQVEEALYGQQKQGQLQGISGFTPEYRFQAEKALYQPQRYQFQNSILRDENQTLMAQKLNYFPESRIFWASEGVSWRHRQGELQADEVYLQGQYWQAWGKIKGAYRNAHQD